MQQKPLSHLISNFSQTHVLSELMLDYVCHRQAEVKHTQFVKCAILKY